MNPLDNPEQIAETIRRGLKKSHTDLMGKFNTPEEKKAAQKIIDDKIKEVLNGQKNPLMKGFLNDIYGK